MSEKNQRKISREDIDFIYPLSSLQEGILYYYLTENNNTYHAQLCVEIVGFLDASKFEKAIQMCIEKHEILRGVFRWEKLSKPVQIILKKNTTFFKYIDYSRENYSKEDINGMVGDQRIDFNDTPFRVVLIKNSGNNYLLYVVHHHILYDGWSTSIIIKEIFENYSDIVKNGTQRKIERYRFKSYLDFLKNKNNLDSIKFWKDYLKEGEFEDHVVQVKSGHIISEEIIRKSIIFNELEEKVIKEFIAEQQITIAALFYSVFAVLKFKYESKLDFLFGTTVSGRNLNVNRIEEMVGLFINTVPLRIKLNNEKSFLDLLKKVFLDVINRTTHEHLPLAEINKCISSERENELFDAIFIIENYPTNLNLTSQEFQIKNINSVESSHYALTLSLVLGDHMKIEIDCRKKGIEGKYGHWFLEHFRKVLLEVIRDERVILGNLSILTNEEKEIILYNFNSSQSPHIWIESIDQLIEKQVKKKPDRVAIQEEDIFITYSYLNESANMFASEILEVIDGERFVAGIILESILEQIIAILAVIKAGGAYLPIDPQYPKSRRNYILKDSNAKIVITDNILDNNFYNGLFLETSNRVTFYGKYKKRIGTNNDPSDPVYIIYTSGSSGEPKGVIVEHGNLTSYLQAFDQEFNLTEEDIVLQQASCSFDTYVEEVYAVLIKGGRTCIINKDNLLNRYEFEKFLVKNSITVISCSPLLINEINTFDARYLKNIRLFISGGDILKSSYVDKLVDNTKIYNSYGPTEATVCVSYYCLGKGDSGNIKIGHPILSSIIYILDDYKNLLPIGVTGEIYIAGKGVARGYLNNPELTHEKFLKNPFNEEERMYRSNDRGLWDDEGNVVFAGRNDEQVKLRGYRIELGEIESLIDEFEYVACSKVCIIQMESIDYLCAYVVLNRSIDTLEIKEFLQSKLPDYMVPQYIIKLDLLPVNQNGKIDRYKLPLPRIEDKPHEFTPTSFTIKKLIGIWEKLLNRKISDLDTDFIEAGGNSLLSMRLTTEIQRELIVDISYKEIRIYNTIKKQSDLIKSKNKEEASFIEFVEKRDYYPASIPQRSLFFLHELNKERKDYNITGILEVSKSIFFSELKSAIKTLVERHESLRTTFHLLEDKIVQRIHENAIVDITEIDEKDFNDKEKKDSLIKAFDINKLPLFNVVFIKSNKENNYLLVNMNHLIADGTSINIIQSEIENILTKKVIGKCSFQYKDYTIWDIKRMSNKNIDRQTAFWQNIFEEIPSLLDLPIDYIQPAERKNKGKALTFIFSKDECCEVRNLAKTTKTSVYETMFAIFNLLLYKFTNQKDIVVGVPVEGRQNKDSYNIVGMFVNTLVIKSVINNTTKIKDYFTQIKENLLTAIDNQDIHYEEIVGKAKDSALLGHSLFNVMFVSDNELSQKDKIIRFSRRLSNELTADTSKYDLTLIFSESDENITLTFNYSTELFKRDTVERLGRHYKELIFETSLKIEGTVRQLELVRGEEKEMILEDLHSLAQDTIGRNVVDMLENQAYVTPYRTAIVFGDLHITYLELNKRCEIIKSGILKQLIEPGIIGLCIPRSPEMIMGMIAIIKTGSAYLPIDVNTPKNRIEYYLKNSRADMIITNSEDIESYNFDCDVKVVNIEKLKEADQVESKISIDNANVLYVMYTSGTTGEPKGVLIEHRNVSNIVNWFSKRYEISGKKVIQLSSYTFDASVNQIFGSLTSGGTLCLVNEDTVYNSSKIYDIIKKEKIHIINFVPGAIQQILCERKSIKSLKYVVSGGEDLNDDLKNMLRSKGYEVHNQYGPTETTIDALAENCSDAKVSLGYPVDNTSCLVLNEDENICPVNVVGELFISGQGLSRGYINNVEYTHSRFIQNPYSETQWMFKTGDLVRRKKDESIEFVGRNDSMIKIRGFRIDLNEIKQAILRIENVKEALILTKQINSDEKNLVAYVSLKNKSNKINYRSYLINELPAYMIPSGFVELDEIPKLKNGKVNISSLKEMKVEVERIINKPVNDIEVELVEIWQKLLGIDKDIIGRDSSFFELGGHSFKLYELVKIIKEKYGIEIGLANVFKRSKVKELAEDINEIKKEKLQENNKGKIIEVII